MSDQIERMMMAMAEAHDGAVSERETGAASALRCANGMAREYWRTIAEAALKASNAKPEPIKVEGPWLHRQIARLTNAVRRESPVTGWLAELLLLICFFVAIWPGDVHLAFTCLVGATVIGVMRGIEKERRGHDQD